MGEVRHGRERNGVRDLGGRRRMIGVKTAKEERGEIFTELNLFALSPA